MNYNIRGLYKIKPLLKKFSTENKSKKGAASDKTFIFLIISKY